MITEQNQPGLMNETEPGVVTACNELQTHFVFRVGAYRSEPRFWPPPFCWHRVLRVPQGSPAHLSGAQSDGLI